MPRPDKVKLTHIASIHKNLKEFGYETLTRAHVESEVDKLFDHERVGIIGMFARAQLVESGLATEEEVSERIEGQFEP